MLSVVKAWKFKRIQKAEAATNPKNDEDCISLAPPKPENLIWWKGENKYGTTLKNHCDEHLRQDKSINKEHIRWTIPQGFE